MLEPSTGSVQGIPHYDSKLLAYECDACTAGGRFYDLTDIEDHMRRSTRDPNFYQCPGCDCLACTPKQLLKHFKCSYAPDLCRAWNGLTIDMILSDFAIAKASDRKAPEYYRERCFAGEIQAWLGTKRDVARRATSWRVIRDPGQEYSPPWHHRQRPGSDKRILCHLRRYTLKKVAKEAHQDEWREKISAVERNMQKTPTWKWLDISLDPLGYSQHRQGYKRGSSRACCVGRIVKAGVVKAWPAPNLNGASKVPGTRVPILDTVMTASCREGSELTRS